jgi:hypothetical protein
MMPTQYRDLRAKDLPVLVVPGVHVRMLSWGGADPRAVSGQRPRILALAIRMEPGATYAQPLPDSHRAFAYVLAGTAVTGGRTVAKGQIAWSDPVSREPAEGPTDVLTIRAADADEPTEILLFSGQPIGEPVVAGATFVMNTEEEIRQAIKDYEEGKFGDVPGLARLR